MHILENSIKILLVEDNPADARLITEILKNFRVTNQIFHVIDGVKAMEFLYHEDDYSDVPRPDIILLDLNLPRKDGREVLKEVKEDNNLTTIPVVILTTSSNKNDIMETYKNYANCFITKPVDIDQLMSVLSCIEDFWLKIVKLPPNHE